MDNLKEFDNIEELLKLLMTKLNAVKDMDEKSLLQQTVLRHMIRYLVRDTATTLESLLDGREEEEKTSLSYSARLRLPFFSHLRQIIECTHQV